MTCRILTACNFNSLFALAMITCLGGSSGALLAQGTDLGDSQSVSSELITGEGQSELDRLLALLRQADDSNWQALEDEVWELWSKSGSDALDLLLARGRKAMEGDDLEAAIEHLSALTDHAPDFAEGWNARATAFYRAGRLGLALDDIARALALEPRHFAALTGLGIIMEDLGDPRRALDAYRLSLAIHPRNPDVKEAVQRLEAADGQDI
ncbi:tetratricopeptide repeat protein [uncultured Aliiroseovarius sp.]|uniref:tetratricopeptide repeat protein n=1 Tax=uncultured Aliiroseovarius sp. TaxID=1658783 RepID=UPI00261B1672|nr:tetratricopeptide repeat protein [uncultured Aliiroseovarius sp.]